MKCYLQEAEGEAEEGPTIPAPGEAGVDCRNYNEDCEGWAAARECEAYTGYIWRNCPKSCKKC